MSKPLGVVAGRLERQGLLAESAASSALANTMVSEMTADSRVVKEGTLFCAVRGTSGDGHAFLAEVERAGAVAALVIEIDPAVHIPQLRVRDDRLAAAYAAAELFGDPWNQLTLVGLTGTNGKTTSAAILRHLLGTAGPSASIGTLGAVGPDGEVVPGTGGLTTPGPIELARGLERFRSEGVQSVAMEVSSHALHQGRAAAARFDAALFTNLSRDHLDYHGTLEDYRAAKLRLVDLLKPGGAAVLNADDPAWQGVSSATARIVRFGIEARADVRAEDLRLASGGTRWTLRTPDGAAEVELPLYGSYNVANALGAAAVLWSLDWKPDRIAAGFATLPQVPGRLERVPTPPGAPTVLIDFAHTPDALERAIAAVRPLVAGRLVVVFGAGGDRDRGKRPEMGRVAAAGADLSVVTSDNPRTEDPAVIADEIESGMGNARRERVLDRRAAIRHAIESSTSQDVVLLAGKGHETYQIWGTEKRSFDERDVVREIFAAPGASK
ncbi:MAG: UDP-N-acetylmuramoyl-L-alanyl-D-glutamate--2,6-diaminopimelate ligase [Gemmatimonadetes bacterium]|nr:UDP-N-acetylmuramoyl-L-alanyl-D-glutamate--2,6-diaminopimelate ligase [Gemmatimonadota bacterium]